jgi:iron complex outermembrane recepter protein
MKNLPIAWGIPALLLSTYASAAVPERVQLADLADLSLEQLATITVTSASRREETVIEAPASIFVLTAEDIRRSGATTLPEALRLAPNAQVARGDTSQYVVSARGGLAGTANKMLVLVDGRTIYTPLFGGVFWDSQNIMIEDVERIEVISGPGATLWGTNAVNGVINVITRSAAQTQGVLLAVGGGDKEQGTSVRYGGAVAGGHWRAYAKYFDRAEHDLASGASAKDQSDRWQAGFRSDWERGPTSFTLQGDTYVANVGNLGGDRDLSGTNVLARWRSRPAADSTLFVQAYLDRTEREHAGSFKELRDTFDVEFHHAIKPRAGHELVWGGGYRASRDRTETTPVLTFIPAGRTLGLANLFAQGEMEIRPGLRGTVGLRAERNPYTGVEWLPNLRLQLATAPGHALWGALTRAVRSPSRIDRDLYVPGMPPFVVYGNDTFESEIANVAEIGYRAQLRPGASVSLSAFHHAFRDLQTLEVQGPGIQLANGATGRNRGLEGWADFTVTRDWRLVGGFTVMSQKFTVKPDHVDLGAPSRPNDPRRTATLRSLWNVTRVHEVDVAVHYVGELKNPAVPAYTIVNARLGWRMSRALELSLVLGNVFDREHAEFGSPAVRAVFGRSAYLKATWAP